MQRREKKLTSRLFEISNLINNSSILYDIGTDHAYLPIYLVQNGKCKRCFACDINKGPLERAKENINKNFLQDKIKTVLSDGLKNIDVEKADTIVIAGMGGELICSILEPFKEKLLGKHIILQPMNSFYQVRKFFSDNNIKIENEILAKESDKLYIIMESFFERGEKSEEKELLFSKHLLYNKYPLKEEYLNKMIEKYSIMYNGLKKSQNRNFENIKEILDFLKLQKENMKNE